uniref:Uncharacterized protein n=1 Tax=Physcomitrium patens TaxID=3218 RepID=A0A7I4BCP9_PHYPA
MANLTTSKGMEGSDKMSDSGELGTKMEGKNTALQEKCQTYLDLWAHRKEHLQQADKMAKAACAGKHANFSLACANAKLNVSLTTERYRAYQTECKLDDAAIKIHHLEWNVSVLKNLIQKEKEKAHAAEQRARTILEAQKQVEAAHAFHKQEVEVIRKELHQKLIESDSRCQKLQHEVKEKSMDLKNGQNELRKLQKTLGEIARARDDALVQVSFLSFELAELKKDTALFADRIADLDPKNPSSTSYKLHESIQKKAAEMERLSSVIASKDAIMEALRVEKESLQTQLEVTTKDVLGRRDAFEEIQRQAAAAEKEHKRALKVLEKESAAASKLVAKKEQALQKLKLQLEKLLEGHQQMKKENADNKIQLKDLEKKCTEAANKLSEKENALDKAMEEIDELRMQNAGLAVLFEDRENIEKGESSEQKLRELDSQIATTAKSLATKDEQLKEITQRLEEVHKENASLLSKCSALEGNLERESSKACKEYKQKLEQMEEQYNVANTLVGKLDKKIEKITQKLADSEQLRTSVEDSWTQRHSEKVEMLVSQLKEAERRCTAATRLGDEKENTLRMIKKQLEDTQKENVSLRTRLSDLERQEESEISLGDRGPKIQNGRGAAVGGDASIRKPLVEISDNDVRSSRRVARGRKSSVENESGKAAKQKRAVDQAADTSSDDEAPTPAPKKGSTRKRQLKKTTGDVDPTPSAKRRPPRNPSTASKRLANPGGNALAQLLVGSTPLPPKSISLHAPTTGSKRKLGSFSGSLMR